MDLLEILRIIPIDIIVNKIIDPPLLKKTKGIPLVGAPSVTKI